MPARDIVEYVMAEKIKSAMLQGHIESSKDGLEFSSMESLAIAVAADTLNFLLSQGLIQMGDTPKYYFVGPNDEKYPIGESGTGT